MFDNILCFSNVLISSVLFCAVLASLSLVSNVMVASVLAVTVKDEFGVCMSVLVCVMSLACV